MLILGKRPGFNSFIEGTAGAEKPRTSAQQKYAHDTHIERNVWKKNRLYYFHFNRDKIVIWLENCLSHVTKKMRDQNFEVSWTTF